jgi:hypothetical protein
MVKSGADGVKAEAAVGRAKFPATPKYSEIGKPPHPDAASRDRNPVYQRLAIKIS